ncbi:hypothetical protein [Myroides phaeus]|uniref:hypothetical protein n=1 Tax=Myroides phaeus TaxID=702745 RepID=UPI001303D156|nr:hypothetical protein [Myroides phaeus]
MERCINTYRNLSKHLKFSFLFAFTLLGLTVVNAQEQKDFKVKNTTIEYQINKNTKDSELEQIKKEVNDEKIANLVFSGVKRNNKGEMIAIKTQFKDERGSSQSKSEYNSMGINPFSVVIHHKDNGEKYLEIGGINPTASSAAFAQNPFGSMLQEQESESFFANDMMELMKSMQEDMRNQQESFMKLMEGMHKENDTATDKTKESKK